MGHTKHGLGEWMSEYRDSTGWAIVETDWQRNRHSVFECEIVTLLLNEGRSGSCWHFFVEGEILMLLVCRA